MFCFFVLFYSFRSFHIKLKPNLNLISPYFHVIFKSDKNITDILQNFKTNCLFSHNDKKFNAAFHNCFDEKFVSLFNKFPFKFL